MSDFVTYTDFYKELRERDKSTRDNCKETVRITHKKIEELKSDYMREIGELSEEMKGFKGIAKTANETKLHVEYMRKGLEPLINNDNISLSGLNKQREETRLMKIARPAAYIVAILTFLAVLIEFGGKLIGTP